MQLSMCATGDLMLLENFPEKYNYQEIENVIDANDVKITNLESVVSNWDCYASTFCGGQWINTEPDKLDDIQKFGFNLYGCANNHSMDYSFNGVLSTIKELQTREMNYAGIGKSLEDASSYTILNLKDKNVKIAFISITSTFIDAARAGNSCEQIPSRPGVNPLRVHTKYKVSPKHFEQLKEIAKATYINGERDNARKIGSLPPEEKGSINFGGHFFVESEEEGKYTYCNKSDLNRVVNEINLAKKEADYVVVSVHSHQIRGMEYTEPDYFLEEFARVCIDNGVCAVIGGGTHQLKPIHIYKGKPIFYSLGNFVFQSGMVKKLPYDFWDKYGYSFDLSVKDALKIKTKDGTIGLETDKNNYLSVIPIMNYEDDKLIKLKLIPIELSFDSERKLKGLPVRADQDTMKIIYEQLVTISKTYGTVFLLEDDFIEVVL